MAQAHDDTLLGIICPGILCLGKLCPGIIWIEYLVIESRDPLFSELNDVATRVLLLLL
jgi:hypothetical protein